MKDIIERIKKGEIREMKGDKDIDLEIEDIDLEIEYIDPKYFEKFFYYDENGNILEKINLKIFKVK